MAISSKDIIPLTRARAKLSELCEDVRREHGEKILTKNGESCAALIDAERLDYYHQLEREHIHLTLLQEAVRGVKEVNAGKLLTAAKLKARYGR
ncbi:MAG: type II toxin-antitoxin system Phd/YefM family antitoxin [Deltaproteobacteria bacterium]|nr:type II toxin-antitoxin system Phd/YefM family antitoxin [Deltaproteobacteria bacterium]